MPGGANVLVNSGFVDALLKCIDATYDGELLVAVGNGFRVDPAASEFLTYMLAYPPDVPTPVVTVKGYLSPRDSPSSTIPLGGNVVLASGGIDSTAAMLHLLDDGLRPTALWCDYGQSYAEAERVAVVAICHTLAVELVTLEIDLGSRIADDARFGHVIPARNLLIAGCAAALGADRIFLAGLADELVVPDKSLRMYNEGGEHLGVPVHSPFVKMTKTDILRVWDQRWRNRIDALQTVSCYQRDGDCQDCSACAKRAVALIASGYDSRSLPVFQSQQRLILDSWFSRLPVLPPVRRADLLIALHTIRDTLSQPLAQALDRVTPQFRGEMQNRRHELAARCDVG